MKDLIQRGTVQSINYDDGTIRIVNEDKDDCVSFDLPLMSSEFNPPSIGDMVIAVFLPSDPTQGFIVGKPFNDNNKPKGSKNVYRKQFDQNNYIEYDKTTKTLRINVENVIVNGNLLTKAGD